MTLLYQDEMTSLYLGDWRHIVPQLRGVTALVTDPPYGMGNNTDSSRFSGGHESSVFKRGKGGRFNGTIVGDKIPFDPTPFLSLPKVVLFGANHYASRLPVGTWLVWVKRNDDAFGTFLSDAELAWVKGGKGVYCKRDLSANAETRSRIHPNQKPVSVMAWCLERAKVTDEDVVLDPFAGSGSTLLACRRRGVRSIGIEVDAKFAHETVKRLDADQTNRIR